MKDKFLPIGTVVTLNNVTKDLMIIGYSCMSGVNNVIFDYSGCFYPEGMLTANTAIAFNHSNIKEVLFEGFRNEKFEKLNKSMISTLNGEFDEGANKNLFAKLDTFEFNSEK